MEFLFVLVFTMLGGFCGAFVASLCTFDINTKALWIGTAIGAAIGLISSLIAASTGALSINYQEEIRMTLYFREATLQEKKEDGLDYRLTEAGANAYEKWRLKQRQKHENESLTIFLAHTVFKLQTNYNKQRGLRNVI